MYACGYRGVAQDWNVTTLGVDPDGFPPRPFRPRPSPFQIICVGRLAPVKGQHLLIAAMAEPGAGGPPHPAAVRGRWARPRMLCARTWSSADCPATSSFEGNVNQDKLLELYRESDALVLSSFAEGLPVVLMEAMAMEIPCVAPVGERDSGNHHP